MANPSDDSLGGGATRVGGNKPDDRYQVSLGDQSTFGGGPGHDDTILESDMEMVDLASRYTIEGPLGKGGMGEVLLAIDTRLKRNVAIKRVRADKALSPIALSRFLTEAQSVASLNHFNIVQVYDYGRDKDGPFLIMEYVDGSSLLDRCRSGAIPLEEAIDITCQLCDGLGRAHELGIVHRDIKPANVLMTKDGKPKLTDFGLAKQDSADHGQTMAGSVIGTLDFMPPEQRRDVSLTDARSDLWSLAATFYQMVTGRSPKVIRFDRLPPSLTSILGKALEEDKADRYQSASEFREALLSSTNHTATVPVADADLGAGECPSCHTKNESHRKFCRECATSLRLNCLSCKMEIPFWDKVCPDCGKKQAELVAARRVAMEGERLKAENACDHFKFDEATRIAKSIASETDNRLQHLKAWAESFLIKVSEEQARHEEEQSSKKEFARKQYSDAITHRKCFDYQLAIHTLESIPAELRSREIFHLADTLRKEQDESFKLVKLITERIQNRELDGLQELFDRAIVLRGNDEDVRRLRSNFDSLAVMRDKAVAEASAKLKSLDYLGCIASLQAIDSGLETPKVAELRKTAEQKNKRVLQLRKVIQQAVDGKLDDLRLNLVDEFISLVGKDDRLQKLRDQLLTRDKSLQGEIDELVRQANELRTKCQFRQAAECLKRIPTIGKTKRIISTIETFNYLACVREKLISNLKLALEKQNFVRGVEASDEYQAALDESGIHDRDPEFEQLRQRCKQELAMQKEPILLPRIPRVRINRRIDDPRPWIKSSGIVCFATMLVGMVLTAYREYFIIPVVFPSLLKGAVGFGVFCLAASAISWWLFNTNRRLRWHRMLTIICYACAALTIIATFLIVISVLIPNAVWAAR